MPQKSMPERTGNLENRIEATSWNNPGCTLVTLDLWGFESFGAGVTSKWVPSGVIKHRYMAI